MSVKRVIKTTHAIGPCFTKCEITVDDLVTLKDNLNTLFEAAGKPIFTPSHDTCMRMMLPLEDAKDNEKREPLKYFRFLFTHGIANTLYYDDNIVQWDWNDEDELLVYVCNRHGYTTDRVLKGVLWESTCLYKRKTPKGFIDIELKALDGAPCWTKDEIELLVTAFVKSGFTVKRKFLKKGHKL